MKNTPTATEPSATWRAALSLFDADLRRRGAADKTRRADGFDLGDVASGATAQRLPPNPPRPGPSPPATRSRRRQTAPVPERAAAPAPVGPPPVASRGFCRCLREQG